MECLTCDTIMECTDDVNDISTKIDWEVCPKCGSKAEIQYDPLKKWITKVIWTR